MQRLDLTCFAFALTLAACAPPRPGSPEEASAHTSAPIVYGSADTAHTAVVALLAPLQGGFSECSGTIVQVTSGVASVLTAAHCCNQGAPTIVVMSDDYGASVSSIKSSHPPAPAYAVIAGSVRWDQGYDENALAPVDDFCMLQFDAPAGTPVIPVATGSDGLAPNIAVEYVGFGTTESNQNNSLREHVSAPVDQQITAADFRYTEGGTTHIGGPCEGDSGGPALLPSGVPQAQQVVVGTTSYGDDACMSYGVSMRVTSETGPGGFISTYLASGPSSVSSSTGASSASSSSSSGGGGSGAPTTCDGAGGDIGCCTPAGALYFCAPGQASLEYLPCHGGKTCGWDAADGYYACVTGPGGADPSGTYPLLCGGGASSSSSTTTGGGAGSTASSTSAGAGGVTSPSGGTSPTSGGNTSPSGGNPSSGGGISGAGGNGNDGTGGSGGAGAGGTLGGNPSAASGCNVTGGSTGDPTSPASLAGLLAGAALITSRRRRSSAR